MPIPHTGRLIQKPQRGVLPFILVDKRCSKQNIQKIMVTSTTKSLKNMETLVSLKHPPLLYITNTSPWNPKLHPKRTLTLKKINAEYKGFSSTPKNKKETLTTKPSGKNSGDDDDPEIPQVVFDRIIVRILVSVGVPLGVGIGFLALFGAIKEQNLYDIPLWVPALTTFVTFGSSALGIAYGTLSTSWDAEKTGSVFGVDEVRQNWSDMWADDEESKKKEMD